MYPQQPPPEKPRGSWGKYVAFGCLGIVAILVVGGVLAYFYIRSAITGLIAEYSSTEPIAVPEVRLSDDEIQALRSRVRDFGDSVEGRHAAAPLVLTQDQINALIQHGMKRKDSKGQLYVRIVGKQLEGDVSIPLGALSNDLQGHYLNGKARISVGVVGEKLVAHLEDLKIGDRYVPDEFRERISRENLLKDAYDDPDTKNFLTRLESIEIGDGKVVLTPRLAP